MDVFSSVKFDLFSKILNQILVKKYPDFLGNFPLMAEVYRVGSDLWIFPCVFKGFF